MPKHMRVNNIGNLFAIFFCGLTIFANELASRAVGHLKMLTVLWGVKQILIAVLFGFWMELFQVRFKFGDDRISNRYKPLFFTQSLLEFWK